MLRIHLQCGRPGLDPWVGKNPQRRAWQPTPGDSYLENPHGQRSLAGYSPWGCKELNMTKQLSTQSQKKSSGLINSNLVPKPVVSSEPGYLIIHKVASDGHSTSPFMMKSNFLLHFQNNQSDSQKSHLKYKTWIMLRLASNFSTGCMLSHAVMSDSLQLHEL